MIGFMRYVSLFSIASLFAVLGACSAENDASIQIKIISGNDSSFEVQGVNPNPTSGAHPAEGSNFNGIPVSKTGLLKSGGCYIAHVMAPDLMDPRFPSDKEQQSTCPAGIPSVPGPARFTQRAYPYGGNVNMTVPAGSNRRVDLIGFINPYGTSDINCEKSFRVEWYQRPSGNGGLEWDMLFLYGQYVLDFESNDFDATTTQAVQAYINQHGLTTAPSGTGSFGFFAASKVQSIAAGNQTIELSSLPWKKTNGAFEGPYRYADCGNNTQGGNEKYVGFLSPLQDFYNESNTNNNSCLTGSYVDQKIKCTYSGLMAGPLKLQCPSGASYVRVKRYESEALFQSATVSNSQTVSCVNNVAQYNLEPIFGSFSDINISKKVFLTLSPLDINSNEVADSSYTSVLQYGSRYAAVEFNDGSSYQVWNEGSGAMLKKAEGYSRTGDSRSLYVKAYDGSVSLKRYDFIKDNVVYDGYRQAALAVDPANAVDYGTNNNDIVLAKLPPRLSNFIESPAKSLNLVSWLNFSSQYYLSFFNNSTLFDYGNIEGTDSALDSTCEASSWCSFVSPDTSETAQISGSWAVASDGNFVAGMINSFDANLAAYADVFSVNTDIGNSGDSIEKLGTAAVVKAGVKITGDMTSATSRQMFNIEMDSGGSSRLLATHYSWFASPTNFNKVAISTCDASWNCGTPATFSATDRPQTMAMTIVDPTKKYISFLESYSATSLTIRRINVINQTDNISIGLASKFYPSPASLMTVGTSGTGSEWRISDVPFIKSLNNVNNGINTKEMMMAITLNEYISGSASGSNFRTLYYRSPDIGSNWYLVHTIDSTGGATSTEASVFENYLNFDASYKAAFMLFINDQFFWQDNHGY